jgi:hypothetical protein
MTKRAQLQIMENAFIMLIIIVILIVAFIFVMAFQKSQQQDKATEFKELDILKKSRVLNFLPEMQCSDNNNLDPDCYDILKITSFSKQVQTEQLYYKSLLGNVKITIKEFDPSPGINKWTNTWEVYDNPLPEFKGIREVQFPVLLRDVVNNENGFGVIYLGVYE